jgi:hypothetical protein
MLFTMISKNQTRPTKRQRLDTTPTSTTVTLVQSTEEYRELASSCTANYALELGCGAGDTSHLLAQQLSPDNILGVDITWKLIQQAKHSYPNIRFERLDVVDDEDWVVKLIRTLTLGVNNVQAFVDLGAPHENHLDYGITELTALIPVLPMLAHRAGISSIVVKSPQLCELATQSQSGLEDFWNSVVLPTQTAILNATTTSTTTVAPTNAAAGPPLHLHPMKLNEQFDKVQGIEICRYHNYSKEGCKRGALGRCKMNHTHCHWCGQENHRALECTRPTPGTAQDFGIDARLKPPMAKAAPFLFVVGGRLRGKTLIQCERVLLPKPLNESSTTGATSSSSSSSAPSSTTTTTSSSAKCTTNTTTQPSWELAQPLTQHRGSHCAVNMPNGNIFVAGGGGMRANLASCEIYNADNRQWTTAPNMHTPRHAFSMCTNSTNGDIFVTGGWTHGSKCIGTFERLKTRTGTETSEEAAPYAWEVCTPMIMPRRLHGSACLPNQNLLFVFGGSPGNDLEQKLQTNCVECYNFDNETWTRLNDLPFKAHVVACTVDQFIYILPCGDHAMLKYDSKKDTYVKLGKLPLPNFHGFCVTHNALFDATGLYLVGGASNARWSKQTFRYDVTTGEWVELSDMSLPRRRTACAVGLSK